MVVHAAIVAGLAWSPEGVRESGATRARPTATTTTVLLARAVPAAAPVETPRTTPAARPERASAGAPARATERESSPESPRPVDPSTARHEASAEAAAQPVDTARAAEIARTVRDAARALLAGLSLEVDRSLARLAGVWRPMLSTAAMRADGATPRATAPSAISSHDDAIQPAASRHAPSNARASVAAASEAAHSEQRAATSADPSPRTTATTAPESESRSDPDTMPDSNANARASAEAPVDASVLEASVLELATPAYPRRAARLGQEGTARVEIALSAEGEVIEIRVLDSSGHRLLDEAAIRAARAGRYRPATRDGRAIASVLVVPFEFRVPR